MIWVVDDDRINLKLAEYMLSSIYETRSFQSGSQVLDALKEARPDLVLLDLHMPDMDGFQTLDAIQSLENGRDLPVVFLTADNDIETEVRGFEAGALDFIKKPFVIEVLQQRISRLLEISRMAMSAPEPYDLLTELPLRSTGEKNIANAMKHSDGYLAFLDVDNLKKINDTMGHQYGDMLLKIMGDLLKACPEDQLPCRLGGDEFLLFIPLMDENLVRQEISNILNSFLEKKNEDLALRAASLSIGVSHSTTEDSFADVYSQADKALYHVKQNGKAGFYIYQDASEASQFSVDIPQLVSSLKKSGDYAGPMEVEYREFSKLFEFTGNLQKRYGRQHHLVTISLEHPFDINMYIDETEEAMTYMDQAISSCLRNVDVYTRYSRQQYLLILTEATEDNIRSVIERIFSAFRSSCFNEKITLTYQITPFQEYLDR